MEQGLFECTLDFLALSFLLTKRHWNISTAVLIQSYEFALPT